MPAYIKIESHQQNDIVKMQPVVFFLTYVSDPVVLV